MIGLAFGYLVQFAIGPHGSPREREQLRTELDEPVKRLRQAGDRRALAVVLAGQARVLVEVDAAAARAALREALALARELSTDPVIIGIVPWMAAVLLAKRLPAEQVARLGSGIAALEAHSVEVGGRNIIAISSTPQDRAVLEQAVAAARETLGEAAFATAEAAGRARSLAEIVDELLTVLDDGTLELVAPTPGADHAWQPASLLSPREREVLALVTEGRTNKAIAEALYVSPNTVKTHVASLLSKLGADSRAQLAAIATERGLR
jgi:DNA-binding NarL/FixJ family response regulator